MLSRRLQVLLEEDQFRRLASVARRRRVSVATIVREAIDRDLSGPASRREAAGRRLLAAQPMELPDVHGLRRELDELRSGQR
ncbi:MAG: antitoxin [Chloroflexota bacterium]|nr:antitoxin [Chloroflexota bacterium]